MQSIADKSNPREPLLFSGGLTDHRPARVCVSRTQSHAGRAFISIVGDLNASAYQAIAAAAVELMSENGIEFVLLSIDSNSGLPAPAAADALAAINALSKAKPTSAVVANAQGPALLFCLATRRVLTHAAARLGRIGTFAAAELRGQTVRAVMGSNRAAISVASDLRPSASVDWYRMLTHTISGEQAESSGVVDQLLSREVVESIVLNVTN